MPKDKAQAASQRVDEYVQRVIDNAPRDAGDFETIKYVYDYLIRNNEYVLDSENNQNILSVVDNGKTVCQGYTKAMQLILNRMGIFCTVVYGQAANENHAWNLVRMDGTYCYVDTTFGDSSYLDSENGEASITSYNYFGCNSDILQRTHTVSERGPLPDCTSLDEYYYVKESKYFTEVNEDRLKAVFNHEKEIDSHMFTIRASSEEVYNGLFDTLFTKQEIFNLMPDADKVTYIENKSELTLTFKL